MSSFHLTAEYLDSWMANTENHDHLLLYDQTLLCEETIEMQIQHLKLLPCTFLLRGKGKGREKHISATSA